MQVESRFLRPADLGATRRNHRRVQVQRVLWVAANAIFIGVIALVGFWVWERTQSDRRFSVTRVEISGARFTSPAALQAITKRHSGSNLFRLDVAQLRMEIESLPWVESAKIEKRIPDIVAIQITERRPVALLHAGDTPRYVDREGRPFALLSRHVGDPDLPLVITAGNEEVQRCAEFLERLRTGHPALYSRVSEIGALRPDGFIVFDRELKTHLRLDGNGSLSKWQLVYQLAAEEGLEAGSVDYIDLRFERRIVVRPKDVQQIAAAVPVPVPAAITN